MTPSELVKRLRLDTRGITPSTTVILRSAPFRNRRRRSSMQALNNMHGQLSSEPDNTLCATQTALKLESDAASSRITESVESLALDDSSKDGTKRRNSHRFLRAKSNPETLSTIKETGQDSFTPTIVTTEKVAAVKISLEMYYDEIEHKPSSRLSRQHYLETHLYYNPQFSPEQKNAFRQAFYRQESYYLRQCRALRSQSQDRRRTKGNGHSWQHFEPLQVLGKGSFGVVRLVREKSTTGMHFPKQVFAMKVIRKSEMLLSSQEGHLRAERDFLVAAEGSNWYVLLLQPDQRLTHLTGLSLWLQASRILPICIW